MVCICCLGRAGTGEQVCQEKQVTNVATLHTHAGAVCVCVCVCVQETFATWSCFRAGKYSLGKRLVT